MIEVLEAEAFVDWFAALRDEVGRGLIAGRLLRLRQGAFGDIKSVGGGVGEIRIHFGPGYRLYFTRRGQALVVLLCGGDKGSQAADILRARAMAIGLTAEAIQSLRERER